MSGNLPLAAMLAVAFFGLFAVMCVVANNLDIKNTKLIKHLVGYQQSLAVAEDDRRRLRNMVAELKAEVANLEDERDDQRAAILKIVGPKGVQK